MIEFRDELSSPSVAKGCNGSRPEHSRTNTVFWLRSENFSKGIFVNFPVEDVHSCAVLSGNSPRWESSSRLGLSSSCDPDPEVERAVRGCADDHLARHPGRSDSRLSKKNRHPIASEKLSKPIENSFQDPVLEGAVGKVLRIHFACLLKIALERGFH